MDLNDINKFYEEEITAKSIYHAKMDLEHAYKYLKKCKKENPNFGFEDLMAFIDAQTIQQANKYYDCSQEISGIPYQLLACDYLTKNPQKLSNIYSRFKYKKNIKIKNPIYSYDLIKSSNTLIKSLLKIIRNKSEESGITLTSDQEFTCLRNFLVKSPSFLSEKYKEDNIDLLSQVIDIFNDYDLLSELVISHNLQQNKLWLEDLGYNMDFSEDFPKNLGVNNILAKENLGKMSSEELSILNMFWQNKYAKKLGDLNSGFFIAQQLHLNNIKTSPSDELIKKLLAKYAYLDSQCKFYYDSIKKGKKISSIEEFKNNKSYDYQKFFSEFMPHMKHDLSTDFDQCIDRIFALKNTYAVKSNLICSTILTLLDSKKIRNWGYINDSKNSESNTIKDEALRILIGIDYPGFNKPVEVHVERELLANCILNAKSQTLIPIYEGNKDYDINFEHLNTHIVLPLEKSHRDFLRNTKPNPEHFNDLILSHTKFLANQDKFPEHLKVTDSKGRKVRKRKYVDLSSGRIFVEEGKQLVPQVSHSSNGGPSFDEI